MIFRVLMLKVLIIRPFSLFICDRSETRDGVEGWHVRFRSLTPS